MRERKGNYEAVLNNSIISLIKKKIKDSVAC